MWWSFRTAMGSGLCIERQWAVVSVVSSEFIVEVTKNQGKKMPSSTEKKKQFIFVNFCIFRLKFLCFCFLGLVIIVCCNIISS